MRQSRFFRNLLILFVCLGLLGLSACSVSGLEQEADSTAAGAAFPALDTEVTKVTIAYTSVLTETETRTIRNSETIADLMSALQQAAGGRKSVAWNELTRSVDGGEGYVITLYGGTQELCTLRFVLNPTLGYLCYESAGAEEPLYFSLGEENLQTLAAFYPM